MRKKTKNQYCTGVSNSPRIFTRLWLHPQNPPPSIHSPSKPSTLHPLSIKTLHPPSTLHQNPPLSIHSPSKPAPSDSKIFLSPKSSPCNYETNVSSKKTLFSFLHQNLSPSIKVIAKLILDQYTFSIFSSYFAEHSFILFISHSEFMHVIIHIFVHWILFSHSVLYKIALIHFYWHVVVHFMRGFSHRILTRNFVNTTSFCLWEISTLLRIWLFFSIRFLNHGTKGDSIVSELYHMRCYILMGVLWIERLDHEYWFLTLYFSIYICLGLFKTVGDSLKKSLEIEESQELFFMTTSFRPIQIAALNRVCRGDNVASWLWPNTTTAAAVCCAVLARHPCLKLGAGQPSLVKSRCRPKRGIVRQHCQFVIFLKVKMMI